MSSRLVKKQALQALEERILSDNSCPELVAHATQLVMGAGNLDADVVFIGEAPGQKEDETGLPFVGASGKLLTNLLKAIELDREDVYITNIVKYRPPNNRDPTPQEKKSFLPYVLEQLLIIEPKVVVTLGRHSMEYFLPGEVISQVHGRAVSKSIAMNDKAAKELLIMPLYHPAAALYNRSLHTALLEDVQKLRVLIDDSFTLEQ